MCLSLLIHKIKLLLLILLDTYYCKTIFTLGEKWIYNILVTESCCLINLCRHLEHLLASQALTRFWSFRSNKQSLTSLTVPLLSHVDWSKGHRTTATSTNFGAGGRVWWEGCFFFIPPYCCSIFFKRAQITIVINTNQKKNP